MSPDRETNAQTLGLQKDADPKLQLASLTAIFTATWNASVLHAAMACAALLCCSNLLFAQPDKTTNPVFADKKTFDETVAPFLKRYCAECHGESGNESDVVLSSIRFDLASGHDMELWKTVLRQLHVEEMPPTTSEQPEPSEKDAVMLWINAELKKSGNESDLYSKLESPSFGNYVNHEKLFSGEITLEPFSPARLWRTSP